MGGLEGGTETSVGRACEVRTGKGERPQQSLDEGGGRRGGEGSKEAWRWLKISVKGGPDSPREFSLTFHSNPAMVLGLLGPGVKLLSHCTLKIIEMSSFLAFVHSDYFLK